MLRKLLLASLLMAATAVEAGQNVVVVLDDSGSMLEHLRTGSRPQKMEAAKQALLTVLESLPSDAKVGVLRLNDPSGEGWVFPLGPIDREAIRAAVMSVEAGGGTPLGEKMKTAADELLALRDQQHYGSYRLLIVTDGEASDPPLVDLYLPDILTRGIWVDVIGVDMQRAHQLATQVHTYRRADDPETLEQAIREVFAESTGGSGGVEESDFELLAAIPDEVAAAALDALTKSGNYPIGERPPAAEEPGTGVAFVEDLPLDDEPEPQYESRPARPASDAGQATEAAEGGGGLPIVPILIFVALGVAAFFVLKMSQAGRKRRDW